MSIPRAKTPSSDVMSKTAGDSHVNDKPVKSLKKSLPVIPVKSKIPKHETKAPESTQSVVENDDTAKAAAKKPEEKSEVTGSQKLPTPNRRPSKSQEEPPNLKFGRAKTSKSVGCAGGQKRVLENLFITKKKRYISLKKDIQDKLKSSETSYEELFRLREKILASGGKDPGKIEELLPAVSWLARSKPSNAEVENGSGEDGESQDDFVAQLEASLRPMPQVAYDICSEALEKRNDLLTWLSNLDETLPNLKDEVAEKLEIYKTENAELQDRLESMRQEQLCKIADLVQQSNCLWRECQLYRQERQHAKAQEESDRADNSEVLTCELQAEKQKLLKAKAKIRDQEVQLSKAETKLHQVQESVKQLEAQLKQKEATIELKNKELTKCQRNTETTISKQKETIESRITKLKEEMEFKEIESNTIISECRKQIEDLKRALEDEKRKNSRRNQEVELEYEELQTRYAKLEDKCKQLLELQDKRKDVYPDDQHTDYEIQLFNDLKETQQALAEKEEIIQKLQLEREDIIAAANEADQDNDTSKQRLTAELLKKSNELQNLRSQFTQLQKNYKRMQQKSEHLEQKLLDMNRIQAQMKDGSRAAYGAQMMQLQQQVTDLRSSLTETEIQNVELEKKCTQLQLKLEHYKRYVRNQDQDFKVRLEMQQLMQNKDVAAGNLENIDQEKYMPMYTSDDFQQLYAMLESKEMQVMKLEKLVKQMEKQEEYTQAQRTRLENRIAKLELALKEGQQAHRNRGFSFL